MARANLIDQLVDLLASGMNAVGLNGTRLRWRWQNRRRRRAVADADSEIRFRAVTGRHKMCPECRSLIPAGSDRCADCGAAVSQVAGPGPARFLEWLFPGVSLATAAIITANFAIYLLMGAVGGFKMPTGGGFGALFGLLGFSFEVTLRFGAGNGLLVWYYGEYWRLLTPMFIHGGLLHVLFNCYVLAQLGQFLEEEYGSARLWCVYLLGGLSGGLASNFLRPALGMGWQTYVGASGAVFALIGLAVAHGWRHGGFQSPMARAALQWALYILLFGFVVGADNFAHIGGLLGGLGLGLVVPTGKRVPGEPAWRMLAFFLVGLCVWAFVMAGLHGQDAVDLFNRQRGRADASHGTGEPWVRSGPVASAAGYPGQLTASRTPRAGSVDTDGSTSSTEPLPHALRPRTRNQVPLTAASDAAVEVRSLAAQVAFRNGSARRSSDRLPDSTS